MDTKGKRQSTKDAASAVRTKRTSKPDNDNPAGHLKESTVQRMSAEEYESRSDEIMESIRSGKFIYDVSGGAGIDITQSISITVYVKKSKPMPYTVATIVLL
jgi:hypothetical protein